MFCTASYTFIPHDLNKNSVSLYSYYITCTSHLNPSITDIKGPISSKSFDSTTSHTFTHSCWLTSYQPSIYIVTCLYTNRKASFNHWCKVHKGVGATRTCHFSLRHLVERQIFPSKQSISSPLSSSLYNNGKNFQQTQRWASRSSSCGTCRQSRSGNAS